MGYYGNKGGGSYDKPKASNFTLNGFYKDGKLDPDLFDSKAKEIAASFKDDHNNGVTSTQLRRIFDEVKRFEQILSTGENQWDKQLPYIKMIKSKVAYSVARAIKNKQSEAAYKNLEKFINDAIGLVEKKEDFRIFVSLFEAVYGYYYELAPKNCL